MVTCRAKDRDNPTSPGLNASLPNTAKIAENRITKSPMNSDHTPIHLQTTDEYSDATISIQINMTAYRKDTRL